MDFTPCIEYCVRRLVDDPDAVSVSSTKDRGALQFMVKVAPNDVGKVIGRSGRVISALRHYLSAVSSKHRAKVYVKVDTE